MTIPSNNELIKYRGIVAEFIIENFKSLKRCNEDYGGIYIDQFKSTTVAIEGRETRCTLNFEIVAHEEFVEIPVPEHLQEELYHTTIKELRELGIITYGTHSEWLSKYYDKCF